MMMIMVLMVIMIQQLQLTQSILLHVYRVVELDLISLAMRGETHEGWDQVSVKHLIHQIQII